MNNPAIVILFILLLTCCNDHEDKVKRIAVAEAGGKILYYDQIPNLIQPGIPETDSIAIIHSYINKWAKRALMYEKAEQNLSQEYRDELEKQLEETKTNLVIFQYQRQMMLAKMDTLVTDEEIDNYYLANENNFSLSANIVKALFIKLPVEAPNIDKARGWARSGVQNDLRELESYCYQFAEKFDDFNEEWVTIDRLLVELPEEIDNQENFLKRNTFYETADPRFIYFIVIRDYRLRPAIAPLEFVKNDIKSLIWNSRRFEFIESLENGIYNESLRNNSFKIY
jgi:hypothetical protein